MNAIALEKVDLATLPRARLEAMRRAGAEVRECRRVLKKGGLNVVGEVLRGEGKFYEMNHYPEGDVFDAETHSQYYYHAHRPESGEHGHFHTFLRAPGMAAGVEPVPYAGGEEWPRGEEAISHLVCISMDDWGEPLELFAINRWVAGECWYRAEDVIPMLDRFAIDHARPSWPVNRWIGAMIRLFQPQAAALLRQRDRVVAAWQEEHPGVDVYEDRELEITGSLAISVERQIERVERALAQGATSSPTDQEVSHVD